MKSVLKWWLIFCVTLLGLCTCIYFDIHKELYIKGFIEKLPWEDISLEKPEDLESWNKWVDAANKEAEKEDEGVEKKRLTNLQ